MSAIRFRFNPTLIRIVLVAALLALAAQGVLVYVGLRYTDSIHRAITSQSSRVILNQYDQSLLIQINDINNLMMLLETPEFSEFFKSNMKLRAPATVNAERQVLLHKLNALHLSSGIVKEIYFIGDDQNEYSYLKVTGQPNFQPLPHVYMDQIQNAQLDKMFLMKNNRITRYTPQEISRFYRASNQLLSKEDVSGLNLFISKIRNHLVITNGNENGVLIFLVLNDRFFERSLPKETNQQDFFTVLDQDNRVLWSSSSNMGLMQKFGSGLIGVDQGGNAGYSNTFKALSPFHMRIVYTLKNNRNSIQQSDLFAKMLILTLFTLFAVILISVSYLLYVFRPFRTISNILKGHSVNSELQLQSIRDDSIKGSFHHFSLRNKLILLLSIVVIIPTISDGLVYSGFTNTAVHKEMNQSLNRIGGFMTADIRNRVQYFDHLMKALSVSHTFQDYLTTQYVSDRALAPYPNINLSMFPGLSDVAYFVILDQDGNAIYSSIFTNNLDVFQTDTAYLQNRSDPYWISEYTDVFSHETTAVIERLHSESAKSMATYLLLVPKDSVLENVGTAPENMNYVIQDQLGRTIYQSQLNSPAKAAGYLRYSSPIPDTKWSITLQYSDYQVIDQSRQYQSQFLLIVFIVFLLSLAAAFLISEWLARPIKRLKMTMLAAGSGDFTQTLEYEEQNEIGEIIRSYNKMIRRLDEQIRNNMLIMEENANNKIRENDLISMKTRAELQMLQAQINPHFLYNTLEAIHMRSMKYGHQDISVMVSALADLFRYSITKGSDIVILDKEIGHVTNYVRIQQIRFGNSFKLEVDIAERFRRVPVIRFVLQPIVENAIKHAFEGWEEGGVIRIEASEQDGKMHLTVRDNGNGMNRDKLEQLKQDVRKDIGQWAHSEAGIGLSNVYRRFKLYCGDDFDMVLESGLMRGTLITLIFPMSGLHDQ